MRLAPLLAALPILAGCALFADLARVAAPAACGALVSALDPGTGREVARGLCPAVADALVSILREEASTARERKGAPMLTAATPCGDYAVAQLDPSAPEGAVLCADRLGGVDEARRLYALAVERAPKGAVK